MIISPPFLPKQADQTEDAWLDIAMAPPRSRLTCTRAPEGSFPLSFKLAWHNGVHIQATLSEEIYLPVRAVADGKVVFVHRPTEPCDDLAHPLNYNPFGRNSSTTAAWTSDGFIAIEHSTDIGATGNVPTTIVFYSACMHLSSVANNPRTNAPWAVGDRIYRKEKIGKPGQIYEHEGQIHFEICCDKENLQRLIGRAPDWVHPLSPQAPTNNGRTDSVFGSLYVYLPKGTPTSASAPTSHLRVAVPSGTLTKPQWVRITYDKGDATLRSYDEFGEPIGNVDGHPEKNFEYELYAKAVQRHNSLDTATQASSSPSGWFELLRFGRNLGPDPLPQDAVAHWREVPSATGTVWVDLNASGTFKFSDADFLSVMGWNCFDDDSSPGDQRCDSVRMKMLIRDRDPANKTRMQLDQLAYRLGEPEVRAMLRRAICKFPCEWDQTTIEARHGWAKTEIFKDAPQEKWDRLVRHFHALSFADLPENFLKADWRFHPVEFIAHFRRCFWLSRDEVVGLIRETLPSGSMMEIGKLSKENVLDRINIGSPSRPAGIHASLQRMIAKYLPGRQRIAFLFAQLSEETDRLRTMVEAGHSSYFLKYEPGTDQGKKLGNTARGDGERFKGRGVIQITGRDNYSNFGKFKGSISLYLSDAGANSLQTNSMLTCDASGFYWVWKQRYGFKDKAMVPIGKQGINYWIDLGSDKASIREATRRINTAAHHFDEVRWLCFEHAWYALNDSIAPPFNYKRISLQ